MKARTNAESVTKNPPAGQPAPSVPLSVYRELAAELQATRAMVDSLNAKNQDLTLYNQKLRQEILRFVQSAINLRALVEPAQTPVHAGRANYPAATSAQPNQLRSNSGNPSEVMGSTAPSLEETAAAASIAARLRSPDASPAFEALYTGEQERPLKLEKQHRPRDLGGLWLTLTVVLIMVTAFGAGFMIVRPLLPTSNSK